MPHEVNQDERSDEDILRLSQVDPECFRILVRRYEAPFMRRAQAILRTKEDAEEVVQDTFTRIYRYAARYEPQAGAQFSSWGYVILNRLAFTRYQKLKKGWTTTVPLDPEHYERLPDTEDFVETLTYKDSVLVALSKLPQAMARVLRLQFLEGKTQEEIAVLEQTSVSAIKTRVHRAKKLFKKTYHEHHATEL